MTAPRRYVTHDGRSLSVCTECGAVVQYSRIADHSAFHQRVIALEDKHSAQDMLPPF